MDHGERAPAQALPPRTPRSIGRYEIRELIGAGAMGDVYRAWDPSLHRWVAIKCVPPGPAHDAAANEQLLREGINASAVDHPAIVKILDVVKQDDDIYIVEELVEGAGLRGRLGRPMELRAFLRIARDCSGALKAAAAAGIVHGDLKPENIHLTMNGRPRILDFGIARRLLPEGSDSTDTAAIDSVETAPIRSEETAPARPNELTPPGVFPPERVADVGMRGTPAYLSPEVIRGIPADTRADIFSLGLVFYEMLTGHHPHLKPTIGQTVQSILDEDPIPPIRLRPGLPRSADSLTLKMLQKDPAKRVQTPSDLLRGLREIEDELSATDLEQRRRRLLRAAVLAPVLALLVVVILLLTRRPPILASDHVPYLAVEPFRAVNAGIELESFALGITEAVRNRLAELDEIQVVSAESESGSDLVLQGSVQSSAEMLRVLSNIVERKKRRVLVACPMVEGSMGDPFTLQDRVTEGIARTLSRRYHVPGLRPAGPPPTQNGSAYAHYLEARGYLARPGDQREPNPAIDLFQRALAEDSSFALARAGLAEAYWALYEESKEETWATRAEEAAIQALGQAPAQSEVHTALGTIYQGTGRYSLAASEFRQALSINPQSSENFIGMARAQDAEGDRGAAERTYREALQARPNDFLVHSYFGAFLFAMGRLEEARDQFSDVVRLTPENSRGYANLGAAYQELRAEPEAIKAYERSIQIKPNYRAYSNLATLLRSRKQLAEAAATYERALSLHDRDYRVWNSLSQTYRLIPGREAAADSTCRRAIALAEEELRVKRGDPYIYGMLAQCHASLHDSTAALAAIKRALELDSNRQDVWVLISVARDVLGDRPGALQAVAQAIRLGAAAEAWTRDPNVEDLVRDPEFQRLTR